MSDALIVVGGVLQAGGFVIAIGQIARVRAAVNLDKSRTQVIELGPAYDFSQRPDSLDGRVERLERLLEDAFSHSSDRAAAVERRVVSEVTAIRQVLQPLTSVSRLAIILFVAGLGLMVWGSVIT